VIYDIRGREVTRLVDGNRQAGSYKLTWRGTDSFGRKVASGLYIYTLEAYSTTSAKAFRSGRKLLLLK